MTEVTRILSQIEQGDPIAAEQLLPPVCDDDWRVEEVPLGVLGEEVSLPISRGDRNQIIQVLREQDRARRLKEAQQVIEAIGGIRPAG